MKYSFILGLCLLMTGSLFHGHAMAANYDLNDISGEYINSRGDSLDFSYDGNDDFEAFFSPASSYEEFYFGFEDLEKADKNNFLFSLEEDDCDEPGCMTYEGSIEFKQNKKGRFYVEVSLEVVVDVEDLSPTFQELLSDQASPETITEVLEQECQQYFGEEAQGAYLVDFVEDYKHSVYCGYQIKSYLKKN